MAKDHQDARDREATVGLLALMFGDALVAALPAALAPGGDARALLPLLIGGSAQRGVADLAKAAFKQACGNGRGDIARLLVGVDGEARLQQNGSLSWPRATPAAPTSSR